MNAILFTGLAIGLLYGAALAPSPAAAQAAPLQNTTSSLQPQSGATQQASNAQNQTGTLQNNNGSSVLNQNGNRPLGVVSNPNQTVPDAVAAPSSTLKTEVRKPGGSKLVPIILAVGSLAVALAGIYILRRKSGHETRLGGESQIAEAKDKAVPDSEITPDKPAIKPEPMPIKPPKKKKQSRRKRKKAKQK